MPSRLDPDIESILPLLPLRDVPTLTPERARDELVQVARSRNNVPPPQVASVVDIKIPLPGRHITARVYSPAKKTAPTVVYFHGGGWVAGDVETHDRLTRTLTIDLDAHVVSIDYRRPPEAPFPAAFDDCFEATQWVAANISDFGGDTTKICIAGDSAGGALAAAVAHASRNAGPKLKAQLLIYPVTDLVGQYRSTEHNALYPSRQDNAEGYYLTKELMVWFAKHYITNVADERDARASPLHAGSFSDLPPTVMCTAEFDPLRDEAEAYVEKLKSAGVPVTYLREPGMIHGYFSMAPVSAAAAAAGQRARAAFKKLIDQ